MTQPRLPDERIRTIKEQSAKQAMQALSAARANGTLVRTPLDHSKTIIAITKRELR